MDLFEQLVVKNNISKEKLRPIISSLKQQYIDSAKASFSKTHDLSEKDKNIYTIEEKFAILLNEYQWLISIQEKFIKKFPNEQHGSQYIQIGNAHLNLKNRDKALEFFQKGVQSFKKEKEKLRLKAQRSEEEENRLNLLNRELDNLKKFKQKVINGEI